MLKVPLAMTDDDLNLILCCLFGFLLLLAAPVIYVHVAEHWNDPLPPHSGFYPECPEWTAPIREEAQLPSEY